MYSTFSSYSLTVRRARSKHALSPAEGNLGCHSSPSAPRRWLTALLELCFTDFMASEIVTGYTGASLFGSGGIRCATFRLRRPEQVLRAYRSGHGPPLRAGLVPGPLALPRWKRWGRIL